MRRVVVTGLGLLTPLGLGVQHNWHKLISGHTGISEITSFDTTDFTCKIAGQIPLAETPDKSANFAAGLFHPEDFMEAKDLRKNDNFIVYAIAAAEEAINDSGWRINTEEQAERTGVIIGSGIGGLNTIYDMSLLLHEKGARRMSPFFITSSLINLASGQISIRHGIKGPNHAVVTACASGTHAISDAARMIMCNEADIMIAGGAEAPIGPIGLSGFCALRALATKFNDTPAKGSRPWDETRDGFIMGEGAGMLVLEEYEHAKKRGAKIYAEIIGYGMSGDAYHITAPAEDGSGAMRAMKAALKQSGLDLSEIGYINAHGTSTPVGDAVELKAVETIFAGHTKTLSMSSTKSSIGHLLGAAGGVEAIYTVLALNHQIVPPTLNLDNPITTNINLVPHQAQERPLKAAMSNSFGFGGTNGSVIFRNI